MNYKEPIHFCSPLDKNFDCIKDTVHGSFKQAKSKINEKKFGHKGTKSIFSQFHAIIIVDVGMHLNSRSSLHLKTGCIYAAK